jgi:hypothetical protein
MFRSDLTYIVCVIKKNSLVLQYTNEFNNIKMTKRLKQN